MTISRIPERQATKSRIPCPNFGVSRFPGSSQIPNLGNIFCVFPNPAPYFCQIPDPENTLPDPDEPDKKMSCSVLESRASVLLVSCRSLAGRDTNTSATRDENIMHGVAAWHEPENEPDKPAWLTALYNREKTWFLETLIKATLKFIITLHEQTKTNSPQVYNAVYC